MEILRVGSSGLAVQKWEWFLTGQGFSPGKDDGLFDATTKSATALFQQHWGLGIDGFVGRETLGKAVALGFGTVVDAHERGAGYPPAPAFAHMSDVERVAAFGQFKFKASPTADNPEHITLLDDWESKHIVRVAIPQLVGVPGAPHDGVVRFHERAASQFLDLFQAWGDAGIADQIIGWGGAHNARFIRGSTTRLSNHSYGSAFDINVAWNPLGAEPALVGMKGCARELAATCAAHGIYWGGWFARLDGMHFEIAQLKN